MQVIQRFLLDKKIEEPAKNTQRVLSKVEEIVKDVQNLDEKSKNSKSQTPSVLRSRVLKKEKTHDEISPFRPIKLSATQSTRNFFNKSSKQIVSSCSSLDLIKPNKTILESKIRKKQGVRRSKSPRKVARDGVGKDVRVMDLKVNTKSEVDKLWKKVVNVTNGIEVYQGPFVNYFVYIGKGNNSALIKKIMTKRSWWKLTESPDSAHFTWFQWRNKKQLESLKSCTSSPSPKPDQSLPPYPSINKALLPKLKPSESDYFGLISITNSPSYTILTPEKLSAESQKLHNHLEFNNILSNKKDLYYTMKSYYSLTGQSLFSKLPLTFHLTSDSDPEFSEFLSSFTEQNQQISENFHNTWIVKPGENTNRGNGIVVCNTLDSIKELLKPVENKSYIIQKYIENPLLINKRKFDIRCYAMITSVNGVIQGYFYEDGYLRTASNEFNIDDVSNLFIHLTNDAIQKHSTDYGKFENGNKLSYRSFQKYLDANYPNIDFFSMILPKIKEIVRETIVASFMFIDKFKRMHCMEVFGYDFMIDSEFKPWLIEVNTNPCLELSSPYLRLIIPAMVENALKLVVDSVFPPPTGHFLDDVLVNRFELIFHQEKEGKEFLNTLSQM